MRGADSVLRGGLIGCGFVAQHHLEGWRHVPGARLVAMCDVRDDRLAWASSVAPEATAYRDAAAMLAAERLDFVEICTRPDSHRALVAQAASQGVHVLCQKPAAPSRANLLAMIDCCDQAGVRLMIHENWRFRPWYRVLREEVAAGAVGRPIRLRLSHRETRALRPNGFADQPYFTEMPQLILFEMGCHLVDTARAVMGDVHSVSATVGRFGPGHSGEDVATLSLRFISGALGLLDMSWCGLPDRFRPEWALNDTVVEGTEAALQLQTDGSWLRIDLNGQTQLRPVALPPDDQVYVGGYIATQRHFIDGLVSNQPHETSGRETLKTMDVVWAGYRSAQEERTLSLGVEASALPNDEPQV